MAISLIDSELYKDMFGTAQMREVFSDEATVARYVEVERALAKVQAALGVIPADAGEQILRKADADNVDMQRLKSETELVGYPILPLVRQLAEMCGPQGEYLHWGATTQDIMDTASVLQVRAALPLVEAALLQCDRALDDLARIHRDTPMMGRTLLQQALPITFGYKAGVWLSMIRRHRERLAQLEPRVLVGQLGGAVGTLASLGDRGLEVNAALMQELGLGVPPITWHVARDGLAELVQFLALVTTTLGKIAQDVAWMMCTEFGELAEPFAMGRGASSTMPQKRNPLSCTLILGAARMIRTTADRALESVMVEFERGAGSWQLEWAAISEAFILSAGALHQSNFLLSGLEVHDVRMRENVDLTRGLVMAEAVMMGLAPRMGRQTAHDIVYETCRQAAASGGTLLDALCSDERITAHFDRAQIEGFCDPAQYLGCAGLMADQARNMP